MILKYDPRRILLKKPLRKNRHEHCVICLSETEYLYSTPIQERKYYLAGCGQLCEKCYWEIKKQTMDGEG